MITVIALLAQKFQSCLSMDLNLAAFDLLCLCWLSNFILQKAESMEMIHEELPRKTASTFLQKVWLGIGLARSAI